MGFHIWTCFSGTWRRDGQVQRFPLLRQQQPPQEVRGNGFQTVIDLVPHKTLRRSALARSLRSLGARNEERRDSVERRRAQCQGVAGSNPGCLGN